MDGSMAPLTDDTRAEDQEPAEAEAEGNSEVIGDDDGPEEEHQRQRILRDPGLPTQAERDEHDITHIPYRPWCDACNRGKAKRRPSRRICGAYSASTCPRVRMDYGQLTELPDEGEDDAGDTELPQAEVEQAEEEPDTEDDDHKLTMLVMQESLCTSVWAYAVESKGAGEEWLTPQLVEDLETIGLKDDRIVLKSDQEPSIVDVAREVTRQRESDFGTALEQF